PRQPSKVAWITLVATLETARSPYKHWLVNVATLANPQTRPPGGGKEFCRRAPPETMHPATPSSLEYHLISSGLTWYHLITPNNTSPFFGPNCYFPAPQLTSTPRLRLSGLSPPVTVPVTDEISPNPRQHWFVTVSRMFTPVRPPPLLHPSMSLLPKESVPIRVHQ